MREFLYLDTDFLTSFMAQEDDGLITNQIHEGNNLHKTDKGTPTVTGKLDTL